MHALSYCYDHRGLCRCNVNGILRVCFAIAVIIVLCYWQESSGSVNVVVWHRPYVSRVSCGASEGNQAVGLRCTCHVVPGGIDLYWTDLYTWLVAWRKKILISLLGWGFLVFGSKLADRAYAATFLLTNTVKRYNSIIDINKSVHIPPLIAITEITPFECFSFDWSLRHEPRRRLRGSRWGLISIIYSRRRTLKAASPVWQVSFSLVVRRLTLDISYRGH